MSVQTQNTNLNPYSGTPIKNLEYIQNKALVIAPFEITKSGKLDPDLLLDTPGIININIYKKMVSGEDKEPTADQFKTIKYISEIDSSNRISSFDIPVIFKYDKETNTRIIEKDLTQVSNNLDYIDFTIDVSNTDLSSETGSNGFFCVCQVQKIQKPVATTAFTEVANDEFLFMIPSVECREIPELVEFDLLDINNKVINIKKFGLPGESVYTGDIYKDKVSLLLDGNDLTDKTGKAITNTNVTIDTSVKKYGSGSLKFNGSSRLTLPNSNDFVFGTDDFTIECWINTSSVDLVNSTIIGTYLGGTWSTNEWTLLNNHPSTPNKFSFMANNYNTATAMLVSSTSVQRNTWFHIAVVRKGTLFSLFVNGILEAQNTVSSSLQIDNRSNSLPTYIGGPTNSTSILGYIDDFRITKGVARYTANFTPPNELSYVINNNTFSLPPDFFEDGSNIATYLFDGYVRDENLSYNGTATDITYGPGKFGQAAVFNGVSSFINTGYKTPTIQGKLTVSYWVYLDTPTTSPGIIYGTSEYTNIYCSISAGQIEVASLQATLYFYPKTKLVQGWNHIVVHHTTTPILYVNNQVVSPNRTDYSIGVNLSRDLWIGRIINYYGSATIDQFRIFDRALTNIEIEALYYYIPNPITILDDTKQGYRIHPVINISDHVNAEESTTPKFYLGSKYQRNLMEVLAPALKSKRTIYNLKDMYLVDDICLATLQKINQQLELDSMIKLTERLYNAGITEKINAEYILEFITSSVANSNNYNCNQIIVDSLIGDYLFTQEEIDNLNSNLNTFKNRARLTIPSVTITGDQFKFKLPTSFVDSNRSGSLKTNLVIFGTDKGFDKYSLISGTIPMYSDITKLETPRVLNDLISTVPTLAGLKNGNIESYLTTNLPRIFTRTTDIGVTDISSNVQKAPGLLSDVDANGIRGIYSTANTASYSSANNFNFYTSDFTIEFDLKSTISQDNSFFVIGEQGSACHLMVYFQSNNSLIFRAGLNDWGWDFSSERSTPAGSILPGVYYHVVFQRTNGVLDIYIDGVKIHTSAWAYNIRATGYIWFGSYFGGSGHTNYRFNNFEVYKRAKYTGNFNIKTRYGSSDKFKSILTDYKQRLPFTYIPLSTNMDDVGSKPVFENLTDITGFNRSDIVIDIPNVL